MMRGLAVLVLVAVSSLASGCRSGGPNAGWDAYVLRLYREVGVALKLTEQGTEASLNKSIRVYTASIAKADALIRRAGTNTYAISALKQFKATAFLGRSIAHWALAEDGVVAGGAPTASIRSMISDTTASIGLLGELPVDNNVMEVRSSSRSIRGRGHVLSAISTDFANLGNTARLIIADGNGSILDRPQKWDGYALKAWGHLATGNPEGLKFAAKAVELEPDLPAEVLTLTLAALVEEYTKGGGDTGSGPDGSSRRLRSIPNPAEMAAARQAVRDTIEAATPGPVVTPAVGDLKKQFPAE